MEKLEEEEEEEHTEINMAEGIPEKEFEFDHSQDHSDLGNTADSTELEMTELISTPIYHTEEPKLDVSPSPELIKAPSNPGLQPKEYDPEKGELKSLETILQELAKLENRGPGPYWGKIKIFSSKPHISLGPDYLFTTFLYVFIILISGLLLKMFWAFENYYCFFSALAVDVFLLTFFSLTVFGDPGIPSFKITPKDIKNI